MSDTQTQAAAQPTSTPNPAPVSGNDSAAAANTTNAPTSTGGQQNGNAETSSNQEAQKTTGQTESGQVAQLGGYGEEPQTEQAPEQKAEEVPDPANEVPDTYEFAPNIGQPLDEATAKQYQDAFKEAGLTRKQAEILYKHNQENMAQAFKSITDSWQKQQNEWLEEINRDKGLGGANAAQRDANMRRALKAFGTPELKKFLRGGVGMNPEVVRFINAVGAAMGEDNTHIGGRTPEQEAQISIDKKRYPNSPNMWGH